MYLAYKAKTEYLRLANEVYGLISSMGNLYIIYVLLCHHQATPSPPSI